MVRNEPVAPQPKRTTTRAKAYIDLIFIHLYEPAPSPRRETSSSGGVWSPPPQGYVQVSSDAALDLARRFSAAGVVILDHSGRFLAAATEPLPGISSPEVAEALAF